MERIRPFMTYDSIPSGSGKLSPENEPKSPGVFLVCGLQGSGKSTVAEILRKNLHAKLIRNDEVREELSREGNLPGTKFSQEANDAVYAEVARRGEIAIASRERVIMDATFSKKIYRDQMQTLTSKLGVGIQLVEVVITDEEVVRERLSSRVGDASTADYNVYLRTKASFNAIEEPHITIFNNGTREELHQQIDQYFPE